MLLSARVFFYTSTGLLVLSSTKHPFEEKFALDLSIFIFGNVDVVVFSLSHDKSPHRYAFKIGTIS